MDFNFDLQEGEARWVKLPLSDSYEYEIIEGKGAHTVREYRQLFDEKGLQIEHLEVQREMTAFRNMEELRGWIRMEMAGGDEAFVEPYFQLLQDRGWLDIGDGVIRFPRKQLLVLLKFSVD